MKESCVECRHHDVFWGGAGCNLLNNGERCKFEPLQEPAEGRRMNKKAKIGKLNYFPSSINWKQFGQEAEALCLELGIDYYIKDDLRKEMEKP